MWRDTSTTTPSVSDWPFVPVPPPRGAERSRRSAVPRGVRRSGKTSVSARKDNGLRLELKDRVVGREAGLARTSLAGPVYGLCGIGGRSACSVT